MSQSSRLPSTVGLLVAAEVLASVADPAVEPEEPASVLVSVPLSVFAFMSAPVSEPVPESCPCPESVACPASEPSPNWMVLVAPLYETVAEEPPSELRGMEASNT